MLRRERPVQPRRGDGLRAPQRSVICAWSGASVAWILGFSICVGAEQATTTTNTQSSETSSKTKTAGSKSTFGTLTFQHGLSTGESATTDGTQNAAIPSGQKKSAGALLGGSVPAFETPGLSTWTDTDAKSAPAATTQKAAASPGSSAPPTNQPKPAASKPDSLISSAPPKKPAASAPPVARASPSKRSRKAPRDLTVDQIWGPAKSSGSSP